MKTAISLPDETFKQAERAAKRLKLSRSELYRRAIEAYVARIDDDDVTASYNEAYAAPETRAETRFRRTAARRAFANVEWKE